MLKRAMGCFLILAMLVIPLPLVYADSDVTYELKLSKQNASVGDEIEVSIHASGLDNVFAYELLLRYDDKKLQFIGHVPTGDSSLMDVISSTGNEVLYGATKIGTTVGLSGDQLLGTLKFRTLSSGAAQINLNSVDYYSPKLELTSDKGINLIQSVSITSGTTQNPPGGDTAPSTGGSSSAGTKTFDQEKLNINPVVNNTSGQASAGVSKEEMDKLIELAKKNGTELTINVAQAAGAKSYELAIPQSFGEAAEEGLQIKLVTEYGTLMLDAEHFVASSSNSSVKTVTVSASNVKPSGQQFNGSRPAIDVHANVTEGSQPITAQLAYQKSGAEHVNPEFLVVYHVDAAGNVSPIKNSYYDNETSSMKFTITEPGTYVVGYNEKKFTDIGNYPWAQKEIGALAARGIVQGVGEDQYDPSRNVTRGEFITLLIRTLGLTASFDETFTDISPNEFYYEAASIARQLGIATGSGANQFNAKESITRQDMMVLVSRALAISGQLEPEQDGQALADFKDQESISSYATEHIAALVKAGLIAGSNEQIHPLDSTTRAEAAVLMYRLLFNL